MNKSTAITTITFIVLLGLAAEYTYHLNVRLDIFEQRVDLLTKSQPSNQIELSTLQDTIMTLEQQISRVNETLVRVENQSDTLQNQLLNLNTDVTAIRGSLQISAGVAELYNRVKDSVVTIRVTTRVGPFLRTGEASGFVYNTSGIIVTNNHVVDGATAIEVTFIDGSSSKASVLGSDPYSDLAVLRLEDLFNPLKPLLLGDSSSIKVGDPIVAIGNPFGLSGSLTTGVVSQTNRTLSAVSGYTIPNVIQIDAAINPGNSGGPLLNLKGEVVGITTAISSTTGTFSGVGFAIPSDTVSREIPLMMDNGDL